MALDYLACSKPSQRLRSCKWQSWVPTLQPIKRDFRNAGVADHMLKHERASFVMQRLEQLYPNTPVPLYHNNIFELLVAVLLSAQCTDERVNQVTPALFALADNATEMQHVPQEVIYKIVRPCGLAPQKSKAISTLSTILVEQYGGDVPKNLAALETLPGVGHKTASVVMSQGFGQPRLSCGHAYPPPCATLGVDQRQKCRPDRARSKKSLSQRRLEQTTFADYFLWPRILLSAWV